MNDQVCRINKLEAALDWAADDIILILNAVKDGIRFGEGDELVKDLEELSSLIEKLLKE
ncbi:hypothetical protein N6C59_001285 [Vibrio metschnikovii]|nr:hypothetical protein [Vibrio metschnikovii]